MSPLVFPDIISRTKKTGFEKIDLLKNEFEMFLQNKYKGLPYRQAVDRTLDDMLTSISYSTHQSSKDS